MMEVTCQITGDFENFIHESIKPEYRKMDEIMWKYDEEY